MLRPIGPGVQFGCAVLQREHRPSLIDRDDAGPIVQLEEHDRRSPPTGINGRTAEHSLPGRLLECEASSRSLGSLQALPVKLTPKGPAWRRSPAGNAGVGAFGTSANGTITVG